MWSGARAVRERSAKPRTAVQIRSGPQAKKCRGGGTGRHKGLKIPQQQCCASSSLARGT